MRMTSLPCVLLLVAGCSRSGLPVGPRQSSSISACTFDGSGDQSRPVLAFAVDHDLRFTFADGTTRTVYTFSSPLGQPGASFGARIDDVQGDRVLADGTSFYSPEGQPAQWMTEIVLLDRSGKTIWSGVKPDYGTPYLGSGGTLAVWEDGQQILVVDRGGTLRTVPGLWTPVAPAPDGSLLVQTPPDNGDGALGWLRPGSSTIAPLAIQPNGAEQWIADRLVYIGKQGLKDALVIATPDDAQVVPLPSSTATLSMESVAGDFITVQSYEPMTPTFYRVNVRTMSVDVLASATPSGMRPLEGASLGHPQVADDGSLTTAFRNDYLGSLYRSTDQGATWTPIGLSFADMQAIDLIAQAGGTFVVQSITQTYLPNVPWTTPPPDMTPALSGSFIELARPADGVAYQLPNVAGYRAIALGSAGRCAAYWTPSAAGANASDTSGRLEVLDVERGHRKTIASIDKIDGATAPLWLER